MFAHVYTCVVQLYTLHTGHTDILFDCIYLKCYFVAHYINLMSYCGFHTTVLKALKSFTKNIPNDN